MTATTPDALNISEDVFVWNTLFERRMADLQHSASEAFLRGMRTIGLSPDSVPSLAKINARLTPLTGWQAVEAHGFLPAAEFFESLSQRRFPTVTRLRKASELEYTPAPDIFHDVFGHVPMHADPVFADFLQRFGGLAAQVNTENARQRLTRLFWFTVEFGLIRQDGDTKVYGSGLISSHKECLHALSGLPELRPFDLHAVMAQDFRHDTIQPAFFVIDSHDQLFAAVEEAAALLKTGALDAPLK